MKPTPDAIVERGRVLVGPMGSDANCGCNGAFRVRSPIDKRPLMIIASNSGGWDHVSVSRDTRCPTWEEMEFVRGLFFLDSETVMQLSVPRSKHINIHPYCLHLFRPQTVEIPLPPAWMV